MTGAPPAKNLANSIGLGRIWIVQRKAKDMLYANIYTHAMQCIRAQNQHLRWWQVSSAVHPSWYDVQKGQKGAT
ncbi:hypothetical protein CERSUDRAFT_81132 [Gelatoporia subvermispora B]|uniref:Uncharacterized protein n=1 Tax=Ceriporiopsis subvermispora (strain B) TaxID=914234 RepID=M2RMU4_CERS8|nr:hypothetical protein CERSUDRAFT_81132 [Gelatoporia subvermispora B]